MMYKPLKISLILFVFAFCFFACQPTVAQEVVLQEVDESPVPPGGIEAFTKFIIENINYPERAKESKIEGTVVLTFVVNKEGGIENVEVLRGIGGGCDEEAIRLVKNSGLWTPAKKDQENVNARMRLPVRFKL